MNFIISEQQRNMIRDYILKSVVPSSDAQGIANTLNNLPQVDEPKQSIPAGE